MHKAILFALFFVTVAATQSCDASMTKREAFTMLKLPNNPSLEMVKKRCRQILAENHPDRNHGSEKSHKLFIRYNDACNIIQNPSTRHNPFSTEETPHDHDYFKTHHTFKKQSNHRSERVDNINIIVLGAIIQQLWSFFIDYPILTTMVGGITACCTLPCLCCLMMCRCLLAMS